MIHKSIVLIVLLSSISLYAGAKNIGLKPEKVQEEKVEGFKNINQAPGLSDFDSTKYVAKLPTVENNLNCNTPEVKELVKTKLFTDESYDFIGGYKALKKNANCTYCSFTYKDGGSSGKKYYWVFQENGQVDVKKFNGNTVYCDNPKILEYFNKIAAGRKITIEEFGGISNHTDNWEMESQQRIDCTLAYKTSDLQDVVQLRYSVSRDEDYQVTLDTAENGIIE